jgi:D-3-phosphoglycerate dehydrogenase / 2-oxoglutarate reductase
LSVAKVVLTRPLVNNAGRALLEQHCELVELALGEQQRIRTEIEEADAVLAIPPDRVDAELLERARALKIVASAGAGTDHIDVAAASMRGILVTSVSGIGARSVAEHAVALMLAVAKRLLWADRKTRSGEFDVRWDGGNHEIGGRTLAIVGYGAVGQELAKICSVGFGMTVLSVNTRGAAAASSPMATAVSLDQALRHADIVSIHLPLAPTTRGLIGRRELALMQKGAWLINTGRGGIVDEDALLEALRAGAIGGAGVDVFATEPPPRDHPLFQLENIVVTPHLAGMTAEALVRLSKAASQDIVDGLSGRRPRGLVNVEVWNRQAASGPH